jgi:26S proteasome regulatory subunit T2
MTLSDDVNLEEFVMTKDEFSGADIKAICTESGLLALRERRMKVRLDLYIVYNSNWEVQ